MQRTPVDVPDASAPVVIQAPPAQRRLLVTLGLLFALLVPSLSLFFDDTALEIHCDGRDCLLITERAFGLQQERTRFAVAEVKDVALAQEFSSSIDRGGKRSRYATDRATLMVTLGDQTSMALSLAKPPAQLAFEEAQRVLGPGGQGRFFLRTSAGLTELWGVLAFCVFGALLLLGARLAVVVRREPSLDVVTVQRRCPPLPPGTLHRFRRSDIRDVQVGTATGFTFPVILVDAQGTHHRLCRTASSHQGERIRDAILGSRA